MEYFPAPLEALVEQFARLPGIGGKTAQRLAFFVLRRLRTPSLPPSAPSPTAPYAAILPPGGCAPSVPLPRGITL